MRCSVCRMGSEHSEALRRAWGCDEDSPSELDRIPCHCDGSPHCVRCEGRGVVSMRRCPNAVITRREREMIRYSALAKSGLWPVEGGALDQSKSFLDGYAVVVTEIASIEEDRMKKNGKQ